MHDEPRTVESPLKGLAALAVKERVALGGLNDRQRSLALGLACCHLPEGVSLREADVNAALKGALAGACRFIGADHVELRRWLVDAGWVARNGFGREYRRVAAMALPAAAREIALVLASVEPIAWVAEARAAAQAQREVRRQAWEARAKGGA